MRGFFRKFDVPLTSKNADDAKGPSATEPIFGDLFEVFHSMDDVPLSSFLGKIEDVDSASRV